MPQIIIFHSLLQLSDVGLLSSVGTYVKMPHSSCSEGDLLLLSLQMFAMTCFPLQCKCVTFIHRSILSFLAECMGQECSNIIFQLGVLILELITGQSSEQGGTDLIQWVQGSRLSSSINMMIDPDLGNNYDSRELKKLLVVARLCIKSKNNPKFPVPQVFRYLQKKLHIPCD